MDKETARALGRLSEQMNEMGRRIDAMYSELHKNNQANIDYVAMMADVEIPSETTEVLEDE